MEDLRRHFSSESIEKLKSLSEDLQNADAFSDLKRRELFRALHTIKGSSQTFGFESSSRVAHKLESLLSVRSKEIFTNENDKNLFVEGIELLIKSLQEKHLVIPASFTKKIDAVIADSTEKNNFAETVLPEIPFEISSRLSNQEKNILVSAFADEKTIYLIEASFDAANFAAGFKDFREILSQSNEIIATLPSPKFKDSGKISFQFLFASFLQTDQIQKLAEPNAARIILDTSEKVFSNDLQGILSQVAEHGTTIAKKFGKQIEFKCSADQIKLSAQKLKLIFDVLIHLTRNAVDHAIESAGKIEINLKIEENKLNLSVSDDGRGINLEKVKAKAIEKNLISGGNNLSEQETLDLIFLPELSTAAELTEISGRGIGLDSVKDAVEAANGEINVKSRSGRGTTFEIFLPKDKQ